VVGYYVGKATTHKILRAGLWWSKLYKDPKSNYRACDACQRTSRPSQRDELPMNLQVSL